MDEGLILHLTHGWGVPTLGASIHGSSFDSWMEDIHEWCATYPFPAGEHELCARPICL